MKEGAREGQIETEERGEGGRRKRKGRKKQQSSI